MLDLRTASDFNLLKERIKIDQFTPSNEKTICKDWKTHEHEISNRTRINMINTSDEQAGRTRERPAKRVATNGDREANFNHQFFFVSRCFAL